MEILKQPGNVLSSLKIILIALASAEFVVVACVEPQVRLIKKFERPVDLT